MTSFRKLKGLYLVVSPILPFRELLAATEKALKGGVDLLQFSQEPKTPSAHFLADTLLGLARKHQTPLFINNDVQLAKEIGADGLHFDNYELTPREARQELGKDCLVGYTVNIDTEKVIWAEKVGADYVSFCSVFPPCPAAQCPIVSFEKIRNARAISKLSMFAAGGITLENVRLVLETGVDGIAVTSAILKSKNPEDMSRSFKETIIKNHNFNN